MDLKPKYQVGNSYGEFTFTKILPIEELQVILYELKHNVSGSEVIHIASDDQENLFCISFKTLPSNSTGVAHILEHTVLCGSKKFPVKDPFFSMSRRSLNTFMNAMTGADFTCYPAASQEEKDFYNLLSVYLDAVFFPELKPFSFYQEGHRLEFEKANDSTTPLLFKGIVLNEMKGSLSSPESRLWQEIMTHLTPDLTYAHNSGGNPAEIPSLTYQDLKDFHKTYYHPSNALFFFYGNFCLEKHLDFIEKYALKGIKKGPELPPIIRQERFKKGVMCETYYPLKDSDLSNKTYATFSWLTTDVKDRQNALALAVIDSILMETDASPLKMNLLKSGFCTQADAHLDLEMSEIPYCIICRGTEPENGIKLKKIIFDTIKEIITKGIDENHLQAAIHQLEFNRLEINGDGPFGLTLFMRSALAKQQGCPPEDGLTVYEQFKELRHLIKDPHYLSKTMQKYLIDNPHFLHLTMKPSPTLEDDEIKEEKNRLETIEKKLSDQSKVAIIKLAEDLKQYQEKTENQSIDCLPKIELIDVPKNVPHFPLYHEQHDQLSIFHHKCFTNHIIYADLIFDLPKIPIEDLPYVQLFFTLICELGMGNRDYQANLEYINRYLGGFRGVLQLHPQIENPKHLKPCFGFRGKALEQHTDQLFTLFKDVCYSPRFDETQRIKELILQLHTSLQNTLNRHALSYAIQESLAGFTPSAAINQKWSGLPYFIFIRDLVKNLDQNLPMIQRKFQELCSHLFHFNTPHLILCSDKQEQDYLAHNNYFDLGKLPYKAVDGWEEIPLIKNSKSQGHIISSPVAFSAWGFKTCAGLDLEAPALSITTRLLENTYLHKKIREQGGAYGSGAHYSPLSGHFYFYAYRDPHIAATYQAFKEGINRIAEGTFTNQDLEEAKLGLIQDFDTPISPGSRAITAYTQFREGREKKVRQDFRDHILMINKKEVKEAVKNNLLEAKQPPVAITFSNQTLLEKENKILDLPMPILPI